MRESTAARAATEPPPITAMVVLSTAGMSVAAAMERGGMAATVKFLVRVLGLGIDGQRGENLGLLGWKDMEEDKDDKKAIV